MITKLSKDRYNFLKRMCESYPAWCNTYAYFTGEGNAVFTHDSPKNPMNRGPEGTAIDLVEIKEKIDLIADTARETDRLLFPYILLKVTQNYGYDYLASTLKCPASRDTLNSLCFDFFNRLDKKVA